MYKEPYADLVSIEMLTTHTAVTFGTVPAVAVYGALRRVVVDAEFTRRYGTLAANWLTAEQDRNT